MRKRELHLRAIELLRGYWEFADRRGQRDFLIEGQCYRSGKDLFSIVQGVGARRLCSEFFDGNDAMVVEGGPRVAAIASRPLEHHPPAFEQRCRSSRGWLRRNECVLPRGHGVDLLP